MWNPPSGVLESGIQLKESGILGFGIRTEQLNESGISLTIGIQNPTSTDKDWNPVPGIRNPGCGSQSPRLFWIPYMGRVENKRGLT